MATTPISSNPAASMVSSLLAQMYPASAPAASGESSSGASASSGDSVQISPEGASLAAQLVGPDGSFDPVMANAMLDASVNQSLFASLSGVDSASFSLAGMMLSSGANTGDVGDIAQLTQLAATASLYEGLPSSVTPSAISMYMPSLAAYAPTVGSSVQPQAQSQSASAAAVDNGVSPLTDP